MIFNCSLNLSYEYLEEIQKTSKYLAIFLYKKNDFLAKKFLRERGHFVNSNSGNIDFFTYICDDIYENDEDVISGEITAEKKFDECFKKQLEEYEPKHPNLYDDSFNKKNIYLRMSYIASTFYGGGKFPSLIIYDNPNNYVCFNLSDLSYFNDFDKYSIFVDEVLREIQKLKNKKLIDLFEESNKKQFIISSKYLIDDYDIVLDDIKVFHKDKKIKEYMDYLIEKSGFNYEDVKKYIRESLGITVNFANYNSNYRKPTKEIVVNFGKITKSTLDEINYLLYLCGYSSLNVYRPEERKMILEIINNFNSAD